jgi:hypothetical protein
VASTLSFGTMTCVPDCAGTVDTERDIVPRPRCTYWAGLDCGKLEASCLPKTAVQTAAHVICVE